MHKEGLVCQVVKRMNYLVEIITCNTIEQMDENIKRIYKSWVYVVGIR